ncbi:Reverse transcriptase domain [Trinorchestia longiramus]|nr:Reverse transcriptase domain [Trinorchestia longiramus]
MCLETNHNVRFKPSDRLRQCSHCERWGLTEMQSWGVIKGIDPSVNVGDIKASADCGSSELLSVTHLPWTGERNVQTAIKPIQQAQKIAWLSEMLQLYRSCSTLEWVLKQPNTRPICLLLCIGKLMECMIQGRLEYWVETNNLLLGQQAGFWRGKSTMDSLFIAKDFIANTFSRKQICITVYLNLDDAYDSVWHEGIIYKLIGSGLKKTYMKWIKNYLMGQTASVHLQAVQSECVLITWGLPQGAVLSPLLFNIMLSDLSVDGVQLIIYADDITILPKGDSLTEVRAHLQRYWDTVATWFKNGN